MSVLVQSGRLQNLPVATGAELDAALALIQVGIAETLRASSIEIGHHSRRMRRALELRGSVRAQLVQDLQAARAASGGSLHLATARALESGSDLLMALAVQPGNPMLVAVPTGADFCIDTGQLVVQGITAGSGEKQIEAAWILFEGRAAVFETVHRNGAPVFSQRRFALARCLGDTLLEFGGSTRDETRLKAQLQDLERAAMAISLDGAGMPGDPEQMRRWILTHLRTTAQFLERLIQEPA